MNTPAQSDATTPRAPGGGRTKLALMILIVLTYAAGIAGVALFFLAFVAHFAIVVARAPGGSLYGLPALVVAVVVLLPLYLVADAREQRALLTRASDQDGPAAGGTPNDV